MNARSLSDYQYSYDQSSARHNDEGLRIVKPIEPQRINCDWNNIKAVSIDFTKKAFAKTSAFEYLDSLLNICQIEYLELRGGKLEKLPASIDRNPLKYLKFWSNAISDINSLLSDQHELKELTAYCHKLEFKGEVAIGNHLIYADLKCSWLNDIEVLSNWKKLQSLKLSVKNIPAIPKSFDNFFELAFLEISDSDFEVFPEYLYFPALYYLHLSKLPAIKEIPESLFGEQLQYLKLHSIGTDKLELPEKLQFNMLEQLYFSNLPVKYFPELSAPAIKQLTIWSLPVTEVCTKITAGDKLEELTIIDLPNLENDSISDLESNSVKEYRGVCFDRNKVMDFSIWPELDKIDLDKSIDTEPYIARNNKLINFDANNCGFKNFPELSKNLRRLNIVKCNKINYFTYSGELEHLDMIRLSGLENLKEIDVKTDYISNLRSLHVIDCPKLVKISPKFLSSHNMELLSVNNCKLQTDDAISEAYKMFNYLRKYNVTSDLLYTIGYWLFKFYEHEAPSPEIIENSKKCLALGYTEIYNLIAKHFSYFNPQGKTLNDFEPELLEKKSILLTGKTHDTKTALKEDLNKFGVKFTTKADKADFILWAKGGTLKEEPKAEVVFFSEKELNEYSDRHSPKFLKTDEISDSHLNNLRQFLWSCIPESELLALTMMQKGGLPDELKADCIIVAKTSSDTKLRTKFKNFLKGKLNEEESAVLSKGIRLNYLKNNPFEQLIRGVSDQFAGKLALALYKRNADFWTSMMQYNFEDLGVRKEIVERFILPEVQSRPHYISIYSPLLCDEVALLLEQLECQGKLKRLHLNLHEGILPDSLKNHITLKELVLTFPRNQESLPDLIFDLKWLSNLNIDCRSIASVSERIGELKLLKELIIYNDNPVSLPAVVKCLPKLKKCYCSGGTG